jgi:hypothetical protein
MSLEVSSPNSQFLDCLIYSRAYWVTQGVIAWNVDVGEGSCYFYASKSAGLSFSEDGIDGYDLRIKLEAESGSLPADVSCALSAMCLLHKSTYFLGSLGRSFKVEGLISGN